MYLGIELPYGVRVQSTDFYVIIATVLHILSYCKCKQNKKKKKHHHKEKKKSASELHLEFLLDSSVTGFQKKKIIGETDLESRETVRDYIKRYRHCTYNKQNLNAWVVHETITEFWMA